MKLKLFTLVLLAAFLAPSTRADTPDTADETTDPTPYDTKFVCDGTFASGEKIQVTGFFYGGAEVGTLNPRDGKIDHIYINGQRKPGDEEYNRGPDALYFRIKKITTDKKLIPSLFALTTFNDGAMNNLVIEYAGKNSPVNYMFLYAWDGQRGDPDWNGNRHVARGSKVNCTFLSLF